MIVSHCGSVVYAQCSVDRLDVRKYSFTQTIKKEWSKLSTDCVHASSVNMYN